MYMYTTTRRRSILLYKERERPETYIKKESSIYTSHNNIYTFFDIYTIRKRKKEKR